MDVFQHVSDVDIHLVNVEDLETRRYFESPPPPPSIFYVLFVGSSRNFHE